MGYYDIFTLKNEEKSLRNNLQSAQMYKTKGKYIMIKLYLCS